MYKLVKNYRDNNDLRQSFNSLAKETFGIDFEDWYQNGYWGQKYIPYSIIIDNEVVANVSVNITDMLLKGKLRHFIQLGTVMTDSNHRNQGFIREIMNAIEHDYKDSVDGIYLFANESVLDFYPKYNFSKAKEYQYSRAVSCSKERTMKQIAMADKDSWDVFESIAKQGITYSSFEVVNNTDLLMFYVTKYMNNDVYYDEKLETYVISEIYDDEIFIHNIFSKSEIDINTIIEAFGKEIKKVTLGFVPNNMEGFEVNEIKEEDTTLFLKEIDIESFEDQKLMFPTLAHA